MLDFPSSSLSVGQKYPASVIAGIPQYTWDGEKWTTVGAGSATSAPPAAALPLMDATPAVVGVTTKYACEDHVHPTDTSMLQKSANLSDVANIVTARQSIYAAPFDAMAYNGFQINGGMQISQERGFGSPGVGNLCDGWLFAMMGSMVASAAVYSSASFTPPPRFLATLIVGVSTAEPTLAAGDFAVLSHAVEGYRVGRLWWGSGYAQPITIGFWTMHHRTGLYTGTIRNGTNTRSYAFSYNQNVADAGEYKTVTIPGDMAGSWAIDNTAGLYVCFAMACGSTYTAPSLNTWVTGNFLAGPGQVNGVASTSDAFRITGVTILPGIEAPSAARSPLIMRPYDQELLTCQRYYAKINAAPGAYTSFATGFATTTIASGYIKYPVRMRGAPSIAYGGALAAWNGGTFYPITSMASVYAGLDSATVQFNGAFTVSAVNILANNDATAFMSLDARL